MATTAKQATLEQLHARLTEQEKAWSPGGALHKAISYCRRMGLFVKQVKDFGVSLFVLMK